MRGGFLDLHERGDQRRAGFGAEVGRLALDLDDHGGQLGQLRLRGADAVVDRGEECREPVLLFGDLRAGAHDPVAGLDGRIADPAHLRLDRTCARSETLGAALRFAQHGSDAVADLAGQPARCSRAAPSVRSASDPIAPSWRIRFGCERVELRPSAGERFEEMVRAHVAICRQLGETLVDQRQAAIDLGDHALRGAILFGDAVR